MARVRRIQLPLTDDDTSELKVGDSVLLSGSIALVAGIETHQRVLDESPDSPIASKLLGSVIYHGPAYIDKLRGRLTLHYLGVTTSSRFEDFIPRIIEKYSIRGIIGKGGLDKKILPILRDQKCLYFAAPGGCAALFATKVRTVGDIFWEDLALPYRLSFLEVHDFGPVIVTMDAHLGSLYGAA
jgi:fumarate hydratase subunit beta